jgi:hypothetical protein
LYWRHTNWREPGFRKHRDDEDNDNRFGDYHYHKRV